MANGNTYTLQEFGQKVKDKYPEYNDVDNTELAKKVLVKYPEYNEFIVKEQEDVQAAVGAGYGDYYFNATPDEVKEMSSEIDEQNEVRLPVPDETKDKDVNVARSMWSSFQAGSAGLGAGIARVPAFIYDLAAMPQNKLSQLPGLSGLEVTAPEWLRDNPIAVYYDKQVELLNETKKKYDKTITGYLKVGEYGKALGLLGNEVTETLPLMVGLAMGGYAGIGYTQSIAGMGALSGAEKRKEIEDIDASEVAKTWNALIHGLAEGTMESLGTMKIAAVGRQLYSKLGTKAADKAVKEGFMASFGGAMKRFYPITGAIGEGIEEAATTFTQNLNDRFNNVDPERNPFDGVNDSFIVGAAAGGLMTGTIATTSKIQKKGAVELNQEPIVEEKVKEEEIKPTEPKIEPVTEEKEVTKGKVSVEEKKPSGEEIEVAKVKEKEAEISKEVKLKEEEEYKKKGPEGLRAMRGPEEVLKSKNPEEIYNAYKSEIPPSEVLSPNEEYVLSQKVNRSSFVRFADKNLITQGLAKAWFNKKGEESSSDSIDVIADELNIDPQEVVDIMLKFPSGRARVTTDMQTQLAQRYRELTGKNIKSHLIKEEPKHAVRKKEEEKIKVVKEKKEKKQPEIKEKEVNFFIGTRKLPIDVKGIEQREPKSFNEILNDFQKQTKFKLIYGKTTHLKAAGEFRETSKALISKIPNNLRVATHEIGHKVFDKYKIESKLNDKATAELMELSKTGSKRNVKEGFAEFITAYSINPEGLREVAPETYKQFEKLVDKKMLNALEEMSVDIRSFLTGVTKLGSLYNVQLEKPRVSFKESLKDELNLNKHIGRNFKITNMDRFWENWTNPLRPSEKAFDTLKKRHGFTGNDIVGTKDYKKLVRLLYGHDKKVYSFYKHGIRDAEGGYIKDEKTGERLNDEYLFKPAREATDGTEREMNTFLNVVMDVGSSQRVVEIVDKLAKRQIVEDVKSGKLPPDSVLDMYPGIDDVVILKTKEGDVDIGQAVEVLKERRVKTEKVKRYNFTGKDISGEGGGFFNDLEVAKEKLKRLGELKETNPKYYKGINESLERYRNWADEVMQYAVEKGRISEPEYDLIKENNEYYLNFNRLLANQVEGDLDFNWYTKSPSGRIGVADQVIHAIRGSSQKRVNPYIGLMEATSRIIKEADRNEALRSFTDLLDGADVSDLGYKTKKGDKQAITVYDQGKPSYYRIIDKNLYSHLTDIANAPFMSDIGFKIWGTPIRIIEKSVTRYPVFAVRNLIRDSQQRLFFSRVNNPLRNMFYLKGKGETIASLEAAGGGLFGHIMNRNNFYDLMSDSIQKLSKDKSNIILHPKSFGRLWDRYVRELEKGEALTRAREYKSVYNKMLDQGLSKEDASIEAAFAARDLMDFAVAGKNIKFLRILAPFVNPRVQGVRKMFREVKGNPKKFILRYIAYGLTAELAQVLLVAMADDETKERYMNMPVYRRDMFYNIPIGKKWIIIPKAFEMGVLSSATGRIFDKIILGDKDAYPEGYLKWLIGTLSPLDPSLIAGTQNPIMSIIKNEDSFRKKSIIPEWEKDLPVELRATETASRLGRVIQKATGVFTSKPIDARKADFLVRSMFTYWGDMSLSLSDIGREDKRNKIDLRKTGFYRKDTPYTNQNFVEVVEFVSRYSLFNQSQYKVLRSMVKDYYDTKDEKEKEYLLESINEYSKLLNEFYKEYEKELVDKKKLKKLLKD